MTSCTNSLMVALMLVIRCFTTRSIHRTGQVSALVSTSIKAQQMQRGHDRRHGSSQLCVHRTQDADVMELMIGGERYEYVPIPDSMKSTTLFVSNLCEFAQDGDLCSLFKSVSKLQSVPACVARKADTTSLQYGFVTFPTVEEKEVRIYSSHGV